jgi:hypothetical protein
VPILRSAFYAQVLGLTGSTRTHDIFMIFITAWRAQAVSGDISRGDGARQTTKLMIMIQKIQNFKASILARSKIGFESVRISIK